MPADCRITAEIAQNAADLTNMPWNMATLEAFGLQQEGREILQSIIDEQAVAAAEARIAAAQAASVAQEAAAAEAAAAAAQDAGEAQQEAAQL